MKKFTRITSTVALSVASTLPHSINDAQEKTLINVSNITLLCGEYSDRSSHFIGYKTIEKLRKKEKTNNFYDPDKEGSKDEVKELFEFAFQEYLCELQKYISNEEFRVITDELFSLLDRIIEEWELTASANHKLNNLWSSIKNKIEDL